MCATGDRDLNPGDEEMRAWRSLQITFSGVLLPVLALVGMTATCTCAELTLERPADLPTLEAILTRYVLAVGGPEAIRALDTRTATLRCVTDLPTWTPPVHEVDTLSVWSRSTGEFLVIWRTPKGARIEGFDGNELWKIESGSVHTSGNWWGPRDMWLVDPRFPLRLAELFPDMKLVGATVLGTETLFLVDVDGDESHRLGFDVETGLLTRLGYNKELRDYTEVDGVLMPMRVVESRKGGSSTFVFDSVSCNVALEDHIFSLAK
jgi:hypothetical protein